MFYANVCVHKENCNAMASTSYVPSTEMVENILLPQIVAADESWKDIATDDLTAIQNYIRIVEDEKLTNLAKTMHLYLSGDLNDRTKQYFESILASIATLKKQRSDAPAKAKAAVRKAAYDANVQPILEAESREDLIARYKDASKEFNQEAIGAYLFRGSTLVRTETDPDKLRQWATYENIPSDLVEKAKWVVDLAKSKLAARRQTEWWVWLLVGIGSLLLVSVMVSVIAYIVRRRQKSRKTSAQKPTPVVSLQPLDEFAVE